MKKIYIVLLLLTTLTLASCNTKESPDIVVTIYPYYDVIKAISNNEIDIMLLAPIGSDIHNYEPTSKDMIAINNAKVFVYTDDHVDAWISGAKVKDDALVIEFEDDYVGHHKWTNPLLVVDLINQVLPELIKINPTRETFYTTRANQYIDMILDYNDQLYNLLNGQQIYYAGHNAFDSMEKHYNFKVIAIDDSIEPGEITSRQLTNLIEKIVENNVTTLFFEELVEINEAKKIKNIVRTKYNIDLEIKLLHGYHNVSLEDYNNNVCYADLLKQNIENLKGALQ